MKKRWMMLSLIGGALLLSSCRGSGGAAQLVATHFSVTAQGNAVAGTAFKITVTALDTANNPVTSYTGTVRFASTDAQAVLPAASTLINGTGAFSVTLVTPGTQTITAMDAMTASISGTSSITVSDVATHFSVTAPGNATAGIAFNFTVTAQDAANNTVTSYSGTIHFTSTDPQASLPSDSTLTNGMGTFSATLKTLHKQTITATDTVTTSVTGTVSVAVVGGPATHFLVVVPSNVTTGIPFGISVFALDASNNRTTTYSGTIHFTSSDTQASLPGNSTLTNGSANFSVTLKMLGGQTITATDTATASITGTSSSVIVVTNAATNFSVGAPGGASPGSTFSFAVGAFDAANNPAPNYSGTIHFTSSDPLATLPANSTLTNGNGSFSATLKTVGSQTITATDTMTASITGTSNSINIAQLKITSGQPPNGTVGETYGPTNFCGGEFIGFEPSATGGSGPYSWSGASLPPGLQVNLVRARCMPPRFVWLLDGTPTAAGTFNVVLTVTDSESPAIQRSMTYTITINAAATANAAAEARANSSAQHHHYKLIDIGTLDGPNSALPGVFFEIDGGTAGARVISNDGTVAGGADTSTSDPFCFFDDCSFPNTFEFRARAITDLGALPGAQWSSPNWISTNGLIAGISETGRNDPLIGLPESRGVLWQGGEIIDLGTLPGGHESFAWGVNNRGQVVGDATNGTLDPFSYYYFTILGVSSGTQTRAFVWDKESGMQDLGTLGGPDAWAALVNEQGEIAGISFTSFTSNPDNGPTCAPNVPSQNPFFWESNAGMIDMGSFGGTCGAPQAINNRGQVAGGSYLAGNSTVHAFLWDKGGHPRLQDLGTLGGDNSVALWVNDAGDVVGYADVPNSPGCTGAACVHHAFLWRHGEMKDLESVGSDPCSRALSINSSGQIVGATAAICGANLTHGFLWEDGGPAVDLNILASRTDIALTMPLYINDRGEIAGTGVLANGDTHAFLLIPCDESHPGIEGCDYDPVEVVTAVEAPSEPVTHAPAEDLPKLAPVGKMTRFRSSLPNRDGRLRSSAPK